MIYVIGQYVEVTLIITAGLLLLLYRVFNDRKNQENVAIFLAFSCIALLLDNIIWNNPLFWNLTLGMFSCFIALILFLRMIQLDKYPKHELYLMVFLCLSAAIDYARHIDRVNGTSYIRPFYFALINGANLGILFWLAYPLKIHWQKLRKSIGDKIRGTGNSNRIHTHS